MTPAPIPGRAKDWEQVLDHLEKERSLSLGALLIQGVKPGRSRMSLAFSPPTDQRSFISGVTDVPARAATGVFATFLSADEAVELCARRVDNVGAPPFEPDHSLPPLSTGTLTIPTAYTFGEFVLTYPAQHSVFMAVTLRNLRIEYDDPLDGNGKATGELLAGWRDTAPLTGLHLRGSALFDAEYHVEGSPGEEPETLRCLELKLEASMSR